MPNPHWMKARPEIRPINGPTGPCCGSLLLHRDGLAPDLTELFEAGRALGEQLMPDLVRLLQRSPVSYGKGAIVGINGEFEHGGACIHPMLGKPMRAAVGGGKAVIPSNVKVTACGASLDVPLSHKDDSWSFDHFDTISVAMPDAPRPDEIVVVLAIADGGRLHPRCGKAPR
jgi:hypothetical protein